MLVVIQDVVDVVRHCVLVEEQTQVEVEVTKVLQAVVQLVVEVVEQVVVTEERIQVLHDVKYVAQDVVQLVVEVEVQVVVTVLVAIGWATCPSTQAYVCVSENMSLFPELSPAVAPIPSEKCHHPIIPFALYGKYAPEPEL